MGGTMSKIAKQIDPVRQIKKAGDKIERGAESIKDRLSPEMPEPETPDPIAERVSDPMSAQKSLFGQSGRAKTKLTRSPLGGGRSLIG